MARVAGRPTSGRSGESFGSRFEGPDSLSPDKSILNLVTGVQLGLAWGEAPATRHGGGSDRAPL